MVQISLRVIILASFYARFQQLYNSHVFITSISVNITILWNVMSCGLVEVFYPEELWKYNLWNVSEFPPDHVVSHPRRL
jgi:hypothetical protein